MGSVLVLLRKLSHVWFYDSDEEQNRAWEEIEVGGAEVVDIKKLRSCTRVTIP